MFRKNSRVKLAVSCCERDEEQAWRYKNVKDEQIGFTRCTLSLRASKMFPAVIALSTIQSGAAVGRTEETKEPITVVKSQDGRRYFFIDNSRMGTPERKCLLHSSIRKLL